MNSFFTWKRVTGFLNIGEEIKGQVLHFKLHANCSCNHREDVDLNSSVELNQIWRAD